MPCRQPQSVWTLSSSVESELTLSDTMLLCIYYNTYGMQKNREGKEKEHLYFFPTMNFKVDFKGGQEKLM